MPKSYVYDVISLWVDPLYAVPSDKTIEIGRKRITLRDFQAKVYEELSKNTKEKLGIFLKAPTGAGKTYIILTLLALRNYKGIVCIYPTKTLAKDQYDSIYNVLENEKELSLKEIGIKRTIKELIRDEKIEKSFEEKGLPKRERDFISLWDINIKNPEGEELNRRVLLILITSETTEALRLLLGKRTKRETFLELVDNIFFNVDFVIVFTVPEYPYIFHEMSYGEFEREGEKLWRILSHYKDFLQALSRPSHVSIESYMDNMRKLLNYYRREFKVTRDSLREILEIYSGLFRYPLFIDEFHLYSELSEVSLVALLFMYYAYYSDAKVIFASATPKESLQRIIKTLHDLFKVKTLLVEADTRKSGSKIHLIRGKTHVNFYCVSTNVTGLGGLLRAQRYVPEIAYDIAKKEPNRKTMVILDRVGLVLDTCKRLREAVGEEKELIYVTSVKVPTEYCREVNIESLKQGKYDYIVGNLAIAQGVDLKHIERGIIYAKDLMSFIQRFGRVPRGKDGEVNIVVDWGRIRKLEDLKGKNIFYYDFIKILEKREIFPKPTEISWFNHYIGFLKLTFPIFAYIIRSAILYRDESETKYDRLKAALPKLADFIREYFKLFKPAKDISSFLNLMSNIDSKLLGNYITFFRLISFRDVPSIKVEAISSKGKYVRELSFIVSLRNFLMSRKTDSKDAIFRIDIEKREFYIPFLLMEEEYEDDEYELIERLSPLDNRVISLKLLLHILSDYDFYLAQTDGKEVVKLSERLYISELLDRIERTELADVPVLLRIRRERYDSDFEDYAIFMACTRDALPIGILKRKYRIKALGLAVLI